MITYKGVSLLTAVPGIGVVDIFVGPPEMDLTLRPKSAAAGSYFVRQRLGTRQVRLVVDLSQSDPAGREALRNQLLAWCRSDAPAPLQLEQVPGRYLTAVCTGMPDFSIAQWWNDLEITFTAADPYFISDTPLTAPVGATPFTVGGDGPAMARIRQALSAPVTDPRWYLDYGPVIHLKGVIDAESIDIDLEARRVDVDNDPRMEIVALESRFFAFGPGEHTITGGEGAAGDVTWYERWL